MPAVIISDKIRAVSDSLATRLAPMTALDERGAQVKLGSFWMDRPAVVGFVRHFG
jgi:hypothetical protein